LIQCDRFFVSSLHGLNIQWSMYTHDENQCENFVYPIGHSCDRFPTPSMSGIISLCHISHDVLCKVYRIRSVATRPPTFVLKRCQRRGHELAVAAVAVEGIAAAAGPPAAAVEGIAAAAAIGADVTLEVAVAVGGLGLGVRAAVVAMAWVRTAVALAAVVVAVAFAASRGNRMQRLTLRLKRPLSQPLQQQ
jgi:hypothetical protein